MSATAHTPLGASTNVRKWYLDVDENDGVGVPSWLPVMGIENLTFNPDNANLEDDSDFDSGGFGSQTKTATGWMAQCTVGRKVLASDSTAYDPGQEHLRSKSIGKTGPANSVVVRIYEMEPDGPRVEAYTGRAGVSYQPQGGANTALDTAQITLTGQGELAEIAHPDTGSAVPTLSSVSPNAGLDTAGGDLLIIRGNGFTGTTGVTVGGAAATNVTVVSDGQIACNAPAHAAGAATVVVTNAAGASTVNVDVTYA